MYSYDEFIDTIDNMIPREIQETLNEDLKKFDHEEFSFIEFFNLQERARVLTIKNRISSTHTWSKTICIDSKGHRSEVFWCEKCNIRASVFEHTHTLSIITKVKDNKPTYTIHNNYLMLTCSEVRNLETPGNHLRCFDCGIAAKGQTDKCCMAEC